MERLNKTILFFCHQIVYELFSNQKLFQHPVPNEFIQYLYSHFSAEQTQQLQNILFAFPAMLNQQNQNQNQNQPVPHQSAHDRTTALKHSSNVISTSPLATAPIHDVLMPRK
jgi:hypothetical protein